MNNTSPEMTTLVRMDEIDFDGSPKVRERLNEDVVERYSDQYLALKDMPPVILFRPSDDAKYFLADGAHRCAAISLTGVQTVLAYVRRGVFVDALQYALKANSSHGLPRSNADKRICIKLALTQWPDKSNVIISEICDVDDKTVASVRSEMESSREIAVTTTRTASDGRSVPSTRSPRATDTEPIEVQSSVEQESPKDFSGTEIPQAIIKNWNRTDEIKEVLQHINAVAGVLKKAQQEEDVMFSEVNISAAIGDLEKAWTAIQCAIPFSVCTQCQGHPEIQKGGCRLCMGRGLISKFRYDRLVPEELKKIKEGRN